jgi:twitching motility protein PilT
MDQHLLDLLKMKRIEAEEAYRCAIDKKQFEQYLPRQAVQQMQM